MPKVIGGLAALVALTGGILARVDPLDCLWRAALAFALGIVATQVWYVFFTIRTRSSGMSITVSSSRPSMSRHNPSESSIERTISATWWTLPIRPSAAGRRDGVMESLLRP